MRIDIDDICLENLLDIIEGKKTVTPEIRKNIVSTLRRKIMGCRKWYKENCIKHDLKVRERTVISFGEKEVLDHTIDIDEE